MFQQIKYLCDQNCPPPPHTHTHTLTQVYVVELVESVDVCLERNVHNRTKEEMEKVCLACNFDDLYLLATFTDFIVHVHAIV